MVSAALVVEADARGWILPACASPLEFLADDPLRARVLACSRARRAGAALLGRDHVLEVEILDGVILRLHGERLLACFEGELSTKGLVGGLGAPLAAVVAELGSAGSFLPDELRRILACARTATVRGTAFTLDCESPCARAPRHRAFVPDS